MIKIVCKSDLDRLEKLKIPDVFKKYIRNYFDEMLSRFKCENLEKLGSIFVLDSKEAVVTSKLDDFLEKYPPKTTAGLTLYNDNTSINITQILLYVNSFAVNIFAQEKHLEELVIKHCFSGNNI